MKTLALLFFLALSLYLLPIPTHSTFNPIRLRPADKAAAADTTAVLDTDGDEVRPGGEYYIVSAIWGAGGGGLKLVQLDHRTKCASDVIVSPSDLYHGNKITITPADPNATAVTLSTLQSLRFKGATKKKRCVNHVSWTVQHDAETGQDFVKAGEFNSVDSNRFKIEVVDPQINVYKITYCPFGADQCSNVGRYLDEEIAISRLALTDYTFSFMIVKA